MFIKIFISNSKIINLSYVFFYVLISLSSVFFSLGLLDVETIWKIIFKIFTAICIFSIFSVIFYILISGLPAIFELNVINFFTGKNWDPEAGYYEILPFFLSTLLSTICAVSLGAPIGILTAVFLSEFSPKYVAIILRLIIKVMSGIPSIIYGIFGVLVIVPTVKFISSEQTTGDCLLSAIILLIIMILPIIINVSEVSLRAVEDEIKEPALALGDTKTKIIFKITIPSAKDGILNSIFLSLGRVIGETMAVMMVAGNAINIPLPFKSVRFLTTAIALEISYASEFHRKVLMSCGFVLFMFILILNFIFVKIFNNKNHIN
ncbi:MAG: phosphate ABC transporter permease subunit PstC [Oscillospiraceae bacterium]|jgi:phosphate transport system permease protein|nr:phosphate ABC transporter permease subunit PstC [Oscillospiraceae bacterium]